MSLHVSLNNKSIDSLKEPLTRKEANGSLALDFKGTPDYWYTLLIYDPDAPYPQDPVNSPYLHYLVVNIPWNDINGGDILMNYTPPNPPANSIMHRYIIDLYRQQKPIPFIHIKGRKNFNLDAFVAASHLVLVDSVTFTVA